MRRTPCPDSATSKRAVWVPSASITSWPLKAPASPGAKTTVIIVAAAPTSTGAASGSRKACVSASTATRLTWILGTPIASRETWAETSSPTGTAPKDSAAGVTIRSPFTALRSVPSQSQAAAASPITTPAQVIAPNARMSPHCTSRGRIRVPPALRARPQGRGAASMTRTSCGFRAARVRQMKPSRR